MVVAKKSFVNTWQSRQNSWAQKLSASYFFLRYLHAPITTFVSLLVRLRMHAGNGWVAGVQIRTVAFLCTMGQACLCMIGQACLCMMGQACLCMMGQACLCMMGQACLLVNMFHYPPHARVCVCLCVWS